MKIITLFVFAVLHKTAMQRWLSSHLTDGRLICNVSVLVKYVLAMSCHNRSYIQYQKNVILFLRPFLVMDYGVQQN